MSTYSVAPGMGLPYVQPVTQSAQNVTDTAGHPSSLSNPWVIGALGVFVCAALAGTGLVLYSDALEKEAAETRSQEQTRDYITSRLPRVPITYNRDTVENPEQVPAGGEGEIPPELAVGEPVAEHPATARQGLTPRGRARPQVGLDDELTH